MNDRYRPADYQVNDVYRCESCGKSIEIAQLYSVTNCDSCGGHYRKTGESYPADVEDWDEERYPDGQWGQRR